MTSARVIACGVVALVMVTAVPALSVEIPPPPEAWEQNTRVREDFRPLEINSLLQRQPTIDGMIDPVEWEGAVQYEVYGDPATGAMSMMMDDGMMMMAPLGTLYFGIYGGYLQMANDWAINDNPDPAMGGANAWRIGTSTEPGADNTGNGDWYEVYVQDVAGGPDIAMARQAASEAGLEDADWKPAEFYEISAGASFNPDAGVPGGPGNWQYELFLGESLNPGGPGELPLCYHWEWRQIDPRPLDGVWIAVYDGSVHNNYPEPATMILLAGGLLGVVLKRRRK